MRVHCSDESVCMRVHLDHGRALGCTRVHCCDVSAQGCMRVHLDHGSALGCMRVHLDHGSALQCQRVHLDRWSALGSWECTGVESSVEWPCCLRACAESSAVWVGRIMWLSLHSSLQLASSRTVHLPAVRCPDKSWMNKDGQTWERCSLCFETFGWTNPICFS